jgi:homoserine O-succinyltransferase
MPLIIESASLAPPIASLRDRRESRGTIRDRGRRLRIGLVNNMPDSALHATARQFARLLEEASGEFDIRLTLASLESMPRDKEVRAAISETYRDGKKLRLASPDALVMTGAEPRAANLADEPFWGELTALMDWSRGGVVSTLYSCLAAHAAAYHRDGVLRRKLMQKLSGVYESKVVLGHELTQGLTHTVAPHSRHNALAECDLDANGYLTLTRSPEAGADVFVKERETLEVFWQGHPEYDCDTLAREYRRDMLRFVKGERPRAPNAPAHYFDAAALARIQMAIAGADSSAIETVAAALNPEALAPATAFWREAATQLMRNWLGAIARRKSLGQSTEFASARWGG